LSKQNRGDTNVNYGQQGVGINKGTINIHAPQPSVTTHLLEQNAETEDGKFRTTLVAILEAGYATQKLIAQVVGESIDDFELTLPHYGAMFNTGRSFGDGNATAWVGAPFGSNQFLAVATTKKPGPLQFFVHLL
jgi:hypothetical protein